MGVRGSTQRHRSNFDSLGESNVRDSKEDLLEKLPKESARS